MYELLMHILSNAEKFGIVTILCLTNIVSLGALWFVISITRSEVAKLQKNLETSYNRHDKMVDSVIEANNMINTFDKNQIELTGSVKSVEKILEEAKSDYAKEDN